MERRIFRICFYRIVPKDKTIYGFCIEDWCIKRIEYIVFYHDTSLFSSVKISLLLLQFRNLRIDRNYSIGKLIHAGQCIDKMVVTYLNIAASPCLKPSVTIPTKQNGRSRRMIKCIVFDNCLARRTEQSTTRPIVANKITRKQDFWRPSQILNTKASLFINTGLYRLLKTYQKFASSFYTVLIIRGDSRNFILVPINSMVVERINCTSSPVRPHSKPQDWSCI